MFRPIDKNLDLIASEHEVLKFWEETNAFDVLRKKNAGKTKWSFLDGPITANNPMGVHHAWGRALKDCYQRYHAMLGHDQRYQNGFDCQGLWVEVEVEKEFGFRTKREIEEFGLEKFINACKDRVRKYSAIQTDQSIRLGFWMDWTDSYYTMSDENNYSIWAFLKKCHERGLVYRGLDAMPWCPRCGTGISEQERREGYKRIADLSVYVRMPLRDRPGEYLLVWTTTPWTLAANVACAVHPELNYAKVRQAGEIYYLSSERVPVMKERGPYEVLEEMPGSALVGFAYSGPFDDLPLPAQHKDAHRVVAWEEVTATDGTGIVHIAPGCGKEDFDLSKGTGLPVLAPIDDAGKYVDGYGFLVGQYAGDVAETILDELRKREMYYKKENFEHDYPHCWRCSCKLLFRTVDEWYIDMSWRKEIMDNVRKIRWIPEYGKDLELDWLTNMHDWMISKKRYWGLALPIFECSCGWFTVVGGKDELKELAVEGWDSFEGNSPHRPWVDAVKIKCPKCGGLVSRIPDVGNPWLDAGIVPYSTVKYSSDRAYWKDWIPADLVLECFPGQFRNWFYALLAMSTMMENIPPFKTLVGYALVRDEHGEEMHKSKGNAIWFDDAAEKMGVDVMRWVFCRQSPLHNLNFGYGIAEQTRRKVFNIWWNVFSFFMSYARADEFDPSLPQVPFAERQDLDRWILSRLQELLSASKESLANYDVMTAARAAEDFLDILSSWYVRRSRRRFWRAPNPEDLDKLAAYQTLYHVLVTLSQALAPIVPFITEKFYQALVRDVNPEAPSSVHHCEFPEAREDLHDEALSREMDAALQIVSVALSIRAVRQLRVRLPLSEMIVVPANKTQESALKRFEDHILDELNIKQLRVEHDVDALLVYQVKLNMRIAGPKYGKDAGKIRALLAELDPGELAKQVRDGQPVALGSGDETWTLPAEEIEVTSTEAPNLAVSTDKGFTLALNTTITPELEQEGLSRDVVRHIQQMRKDADFDLLDHVCVTFRTEDDLLRGAIERHAGFIKAETLCDALEAGETGDGEAHSLSGHKIYLSVAKV